MGAFYPRLDGLRTFAVLSVMVFHWNAPELFDRALPLGFVGVQLFFVLSGYLIGGILLRAQARNGDDGTSQLFTLRQFVIRRGLRIFPAYFAFLLLTGLLMGAPDPNWWWYPLYLSNVHIAATSVWPDYWSHTWTLAVEEQFYLFAPLVVLLLRRRVFVAALSALVIVSGGFVLLTSARTGAAIVPPKVFYGLLIGVALALITEQFSVRSGVMALIGVLSTAVSVAAFTHDSMDGQLLELAAPVSFAALVWWATGTTRTGRFLEWQPLTSVGGLAYGLYLWHMPVPEMWRRLDFPAAENSWAMFIPYCLVTLAMAKVSWIVVERPLNGLKERFPYHEPGPATRAAMGEDVSAVSAIRRVSPAADQYASESPSSPMTMSHRSRQSLQR